MRILFVTKHYYPGAGDRTYMFALEKLLREHDHDIGYFAMSDDSNIASPFSGYFIDNINYTELRKNINILTGMKVVARALYSSESAKKIKSLINDFQPDIVHIQHLDTHITYSILPAIRKCGIPIIWSLHIYAPLCINYNLINENTGQICEACRKKKFYKAAVNRCKRGNLLSSFMGTLVQYFNYLWGFIDHVDVFLCPSKFVRNLFIDWGFDPQKLVLLPNFTYCDDITPRYGGNGYGLYIGRMVPEKGAAILLSSLEDIDIPFKFIGDGPLLEDLKQRADMPGLNNIEFLGFKTGEEFRKIVSNSNFVVIPSQWHEVFGLVILEAYAHGKPVIGSRAGGIPELIDDGETGYLFDTRDDRSLSNKIRMISNDPDEATRMGKNAREKINDLLNPSLHYAKLMEVYSSISKKLP
jgi:glycosyltransferase involved in cell wall biosynthesis